MTRRLWVVMGATLALGGCVPGGGAGDGGEAPDASAAEPVVDPVEGLVAIEVSMRPTYALVPGLTRDFFAEGRYADGQTRDVTEAAEWRSSEPGVLTFDDPEHPGRASVHATVPPEPTVTATLGGITGSMTIASPCDYPDFGGRIAPGTTMPPLEWDDASLPDGTRGRLSLGDMYCGTSDGPVPPILVFVTVANWCPACEGYMYTVAEKAGALRAAGGEYVIISVENLDFEPASTEQAVRHFDPLLGMIPSYIVGDGDVGQTIARSGTVTGYPSVFVVRTSDMKVIADDATAFLLDLPTAAADPQILEDAPPEVMIDNHCAPDGDEIYEPNDTPDTPAVIGPGSFDGGVCNQYPDFYRIDVDGPWRLTLDFSHAVGNLDVYGWDAEKNAPLRVGNLVVGSSGRADGEVLEHAGPTLVRVGGFDFESAPYVLTVEAL